MSNLIENRPHLTDAAISVAKEIFAALQDRTDVGTWGKRPTDSATEMYALLQMEGLDPVDLAFSILQIAHQRKEISVSGTMMGADVGPSGGFCTGEETFSCGRVDIQATDKEYVDFQSGGFWASGRFSATNRDQLLVVDIDLGFIKAEI
jgi:hypothetical protein